MFRRKRRSLQRIRRKANSYNHNIECRFRVEGLRDAFPDSEAAFFFEGCEAGGCFMLARKPDTIREELYEKRTDGRGGCGKGEFPQ